MIKNCYFKCSRCNEIKCVYMDDQFVSNIEKFHLCDKCEAGELVYQKDYVPEVNDVIVKNELKDNRRFDKNKYKDSRYKDKIDAIKNTYLKGVK